MIEASLKEIQSEKALPVVLDASLMPEKNSSVDSIPWVNVYYCQTGSNDTVVILDTQYYGVNVNVKDVTPWAEVDEANKFNRCRVNLTEEALQRIKKLKYKYAHLTVVVDD